MVFPITVLPKLVVPNQCSHFLGTILLYTLGCYQLISASRTYVGEVDEQLLTTIIHQTKILRRFSSSIRIESSTVVSAF